MHELKTSIQCTKTILREFSVKKKDDKLDYWVQRYLQAKTEGDKRKMQFYADIIRKLGGKVPKI